jgi:hypothetical protein
MIYNMFMILLLILSLILVGINQTDIGLIIYTMSIMMLFFTFYIEYLLYSCNFSTVRLYDVSNISTTLLHLGILIGIILYIIPTLFQEEVEYNNFYIFSGLILCSSIIFINLGLKHNLGLFILKLCTIIPIILLCIQKEYIPLIGSVILSVLLLFILYYKKSILTRIIISLLIVGLILLHFEYNIAILCIVFSVCYLLNHIVYRWDFSNITKKLKGKFKYGGVPGVLGGIGQGFVQPSFL